MASIAGVFVRNVQTRSRTRLTHTSFESNCLGSMDGLPSGSLVCADPVAIRATSVDSASGDNPVHGNRAS